MDELKKQAKIEIFKKTAAEVTDKNHTTAKEEKPEKQPATSE